MSATVFMRIDSPSPAGMDGCFFLHPEKERTAARTSKIANPGAPILLITRSPREDLRTSPAAASPCGGMLEQPRPAPLRRRAGDRNVAVPATREESRAPAARSRRPPEEGCRHPASVDPTGHRRGGLPPARAASPTQADPTGNASSPRGPPG